MLKNSILICYSTPNYDLITRYFLKTAIISGLDEHNIFHKLDIPSESLLINNFGFGSDLWYHCTYSKIFHLIEILNNFALVDNSIKYFIFSDCDVNILKNDDAWNALENYINNTNNDIYFMRENNDDVNSGFFIIKNNDKIIELIDFFIFICKEFKNTSKKNMPLGDQTLINHYKKNINFGYIPNEYIIAGKIIFDINKSIIYHMLGCQTIYDKYNQMCYIKKILQNNKMSIFEYNNILNNNLIHFQKLEKISATYDIKPVIFKDTSYTTSHLNMLDDIHKNDDYFKKYKYINLYMLGAKNVLNILYVGVNDFKPLLLFLLATNTSHIYIYSYGNIAYLNCMVSYLNDIFINRITCVQNYHIAPHDNYFDMIYFDNDSDTAFDIDEFFYGTFESLKKYIVFNNSNEKATNVKIQKYINNNLLSMNHNFYPSYYNEHSILDKVQ